MVRTYKRKLILTSEQSRRIHSWIGCCRVVYNLGLEIKIAAYKRTGKSVSKYDLMKQLPDLKKDYDWIRDVPSQSLQASLDKLEISYQNFFRNRRKGGGFPKFARKGKFRSILFKSVSVDGNYVSIPKMGSIKMFRDSEITGTPKTATIIIEPTGIFICIQCKHVPQKFVSENQTCGLDMGISHFCINDEGKFIANPRHFSKYERQLRIENRSLARKRKGSNSWRRQSERLAMLHHKIGNVRKDFLHKESTNIAKMNHVVYMEDLNIAGMSRNKNLSKHILDCGWGTFRTMLEYKTRVVKVNPRYTSQRCHECKHKDKASRISQAAFCCTSCGHKNNADINAARNTRSEGIASDRQREPSGCA